MNYMVTGEAVSVSDVPVIIAVRFSNLTHGKDKGNRLVWHVLLGDIQLTVTVRLL